MARVVAVGRGVDVALGAGVDVAVAEIVGVGLGSTTAVGVAVGDVAGMGVIVGNCVSVADGSTLTNPVGWLVGIGAARVTVSCRSIVWGIPDGEHVTKIRQRPIPPAMAARVTNAFCIDSLNIDRVLPLSDTVSIATGWKRGMVACLVQPSRSILCHQFLRTTGKWCL